MELMTKEAAEKLNSVQLRILVRKMGWIGASVLTATKEEKFIFATTGRKPAWVTALKAMTGTPHSDGQVDMPAAAPEILPTISTDTVQQPLNLVDTAADAVLLPAATEAVSMAVEAQEPVPAAMPDTPADKPSLYDFDMTTRFLRTLTGNDDEAITLQVFDDKKLDTTLARWMHWQRSTANYKKLAALQSKGAGIYIMVNRGDCKGRSAINVVEVRALFVDLDGAPWEPAADMLKPHIMVESSPGRFHLYWLVSDCPPNRFTALQKAIARQFDGDEKCVDLARVLRLPGFIHLKKEPVLTKLIEANNFPKYTTQQVINCLQLDMTDSEKTPAIKPAVTRPAPAPADPKTPAPVPTASRAYEILDAITGELIPLSTWAAQHPSFNLVAAIDPQYRRGNPKEDGKQHIACPFESEHTDQGDDLATFAANASPPEHPSFTIFCQHAHCAGRDRLDYIAAMLEKGWITIDQIRPTAPAEIELKHPPYVNYRAQEIASRLQISPLQPEEFRTLLHLMHIAWSSQDGTLPDDDWMLHRAMGLTEEKWLKCRAMLIRAGWLVTENGRLIDPIAKREYDNSQAALMAKSIGGSIGGKTSQRKKKHTL